MKKTQTAHRVVELSALLARLGELTGEENNLLSQLNSSNEAAEPVCLAATQQMLARIAVVQNQRLSTALSYLKVLTDGVLLAERSQVECRTELAEQKRNIQMMCEVIQTLDDPYGFGQTLDDAISQDLSAPDEE